MQKSQHTFNFLHQIIHFAVVAVFHTLTMTWELDSLALVQTIGSSDFFVQPGRSEQSYRWDLNFSKSDIYIHTQKFKVL